MKQKDFVNTLPYISNPIEEFRNYKFVSWERDIYPKFKGGTKQEEIDFFVDIIIKNNYIIAKFESPFFCNAKPQFSYQEERLEVFKT